MPEAAAANLDALLEGLNEPQREAVTHVDGPLLVLAGAGSGKTRVLTHRIAYLLATGAAQPHEILAITFTNKAASEMRERVEGLVGRRTRAMWVMTFHAACARMLRADATKLGYTRSFTIYDQADSRRVVKHCIDELGIDPKRFTPAAIHNQISDAKNKLRDADAYGQMVGSYFEQTVADVFRMYESELHRMNAMDFDDLLVRAVNVMELFPEVRERYANAFRYVLVDEYQDTNAAQFRWLQLLTEESRNLMVVGDDDQSVYSFRGADIRNILDFEEVYADAAVVKLEQNYRSTQTILSAANAVVAHNRGRKSKSLWTDKGEGDRIIVRELEDEHAESRYVAGEIERLVDEGAARSEIAVFYRTNGQSRVLEDRLRRTGLPYQVIGGVKFYDRSEVKDALAYLVLLVNPQDETAFARVVNSPKRGLGQTSVSRVLAWANTTGQSVWDAAGDPEAIPTLGAAARKALGRFMGTMRILKERADTNPPVAELLEETLRETGYTEALQNERTFEAQGRLENLEALVEGAHEYDGTAEDAILLQHLETLSLRGDQDEVKDGAGSVTLMSLHTAKGLEYPIVFIVGCEDGVFPHSRALDEGQLEEERRLAYVGITRAMRQLYLTHARRRNVFGAAMGGVPSRFLHELPDDLVERQGASPWGSPRPSAMTWDSAAEEVAEPVAYRLGDDVRHAAFGVGKVIGVEPGGIVVLHFRDHGDRKFVADMAPLEKA